MRAPPDHRYTVLVVPERGKGEVRQRVVSLRHAQAATAAIALVLAALTGAAGIAVWAVPRALERERVGAENAALLVQLDEVAGRVAKVETLVTRVAGVDDQLRDAARAGLLPGGGPLTDEDAALFEAWLDARDTPVSPERLPGSPVDRARALTDRTGDLELEVDALLTLLPGLEDHVQRLNDRHAAMPDRWPLSGTLTSGFGWRRFPFGGQRSFHRGIDIGVPSGTPIVATAAGVVTRSDGNAARGRTVVIDHGSGIVTRYGHCSLLVVAPGDEVAAGDIIAYSGNSGLSTGPHLHYDLIIDGEPVDALDHLP